MNILSRGSAAIVGVAESDLGQMAPGTTTIDLMAQATGRALEECGLTLADIDGVFSATAQARFAPMMLAEYLSIKPRYFDGTQIGESEPEVALVDRIVLTTVPEPGLALLAAAGASAAGAARARRRHATGCAPTAIATTTSHRTAGSGTVSSTIRSTTKLSS